MGRACIDCDFWHFFLCDLSGESSSVWSSGGPRAAQTSQWVQCTTYHSRKVCQQSYPHLCIVFHDHPQSHEAAVHLHGEGELSPDVIFQWFFKANLLYRYNFLQVIQMFKGCKKDDMPPHVYAVAQSAYRQMLTTRLDQSLVTMGRSGSGKTVNFYHIISYLCHAAGTSNRSLTG